MVQKLYLELKNQSKEKEHLVSVTVESFICLFLLKYVDHPEDIVVHLVVENKTTSNGLTESEATLEIDISHLNCLILPRDTYQQKIASNCNFPVLLTNRSIVIAGLCGVCRNLVKNADEKYGELLGFKGSCLVAPSEASVWTKFCEVDIIQCTKDILKQKSLIDGNGRSDTLDLPGELVRFESHMSQPIRKHNVYKHARELVKEQEKRNKVNEINLESLSIQDSIVPEEKKDDVPEKRKYVRKTKIKKITSGAPIESLNLDHKYVEGTQLSIADIILYPSFWIIREVLLSLSEETNNLPSLLPLTFKWLTIIETEVEQKLLKCLSFYNIQQSFSVNMAQGLYTYRMKGGIQKYSLYKSDPKRYKPSNRIFTKQKDIETSLAKVENLNLDITSNSEAILVANKDINDEDFGWNSMPFETLPEAGELPEKRLMRKKYQLESLAKQIIRIARDGDRIIDFCSGSGHLGIILAYKLPKCEVVLLENKEESLMRAKERVDLLKLQNVQFFQCNLDYFRGDFDIGTSLHACGVATDIVLMHCIDRRASFVCCPCCYGGCHQMPHISYPRSGKFQTNDISNQDFMHLAHCADQSHAIDVGKSNILKSVQGQFCMDVVDTDRKLYAEEVGYKVMLCRLYPEDCTPKNRLLVGVI